jgi:hypothetical protein
VEVTVVAHLALAVLEALAAAAVMLPTPQGHRGKALLVVQALRRILQAAVAALVALGVISAAVSRAALVALLLPH